MSLDRRELLFRRIRKLFLAEFLEAIVAAILIAVLLRVFVVAVYRVPTTSMLPNLVPGDFIVAWKTSYGVRLPGVTDALGAKIPERGDVIVFELAENEPKNEPVTYVKRVVGVPGDRIEIRDSILSVNDEIVGRLESGFDGDSGGDFGGFDLFSERSGESTRRVISRKDREPEFLAGLIVPPGHVYVLGDHRSESEDSRQWGPVPVSGILGRAAFIGFSVELAGAPDASVWLQGRNRLSRIFQRIE